MENVKNYYFFRCSFCGAWYYSNKILKKKKCWKCNRTFQFQNSIKFSKKCSIRIAIAILKELKKKAEEENLSKYLNFEKQVKFTKLK